MTNRSRLGLLLAAVGLAAMVLSGLAVAAALRDAGVTDPEARGRGALYALGATAVLGLALAVAYALIERRLLRPAAVLARAALTLAQSVRIDRPLAPPPAHDLGALPGAVADLAEALRRARGEAAAAEAAAAARAAEQKGWLEAILLDLAEGVLVCNAAHRILLYNQAAVRLLDAPEAVGLGRPLFAVLGSAPVLHTLDALRHGEAAADPGPAGTRAFVCATADGRTLLHARMVLLPATPGDEPENGRGEGYVLTLGDLRDRLAAIAEADAVRDTLTRGLRGPAAALRAAAETLTAFPAMAEADRLAFHQAMARDAATVSRLIEDAAATFRDLGAVRWPMTDLHAADLFACVARRIGERLPVSVTATGIPLWLHGDSLALALLLDTLIGRLHAATHADAFDLEAMLGDRRVYVDILWRGAPLPAAAIDGWQDAILEGGIGPLSVRAVLDRHGAEMWCETRRDGRAALRLPLPAPDRPQFQPAARPLPPRPEFYDFTLIGAAEPPADLAALPLRAVPYVVFDTETTGLHPTEGDAILSIAGVRVVQGRVLSGETFDRLIDPQRPIPPESIRFHGITEAMVAGRPPLEVVLPQFRTFVGDAVLVAHNAAFDLKFLRLKEAETGIAFINPVLDTLLLSALLDPEEPEHNLDAITARLGVAVGGRHTALGDALATAEVLVRLIDRLEARGITTLGEVLRQANMAAELRRREQRL